jgi:DNA-binding transcriptional MerR regulator
MLINEAGKKTQLTKKAIEYYAEQNLVFPAVLENGYRDFTQADIENLRKIAVLRKLGLGTQEIKAVLSDDTGDALQKAAIQKVLQIKQEQAKTAALESLCHGKSYDEIAEQLESIKQNATIAEKLLDRFPGYFGRFVCLHFARFLNQPIISEEQRQALDEITAFLDNMPAFDFPEDVRAFLDESTSEYTAEAITKILENASRSIENIGEFLSDKESFIEEWIAYKQSPEYKSSVFFKAETLLKDFCGASGYHDIFIPAMKRLSKPYAAYIQRAEAANEELLSRFPSLNDRY